MLRRYTAPVRPKASIFVQVLIAMLLVSLIPLTGFWWLNTQRTERDLLASIEASLRQTSDALVDRADAWVDLNVRMLEHAARLDVIQSMDARLQDPYLKAMSRTYEWIYLAFTVDPDGQNVGRNDGKNAADFYFGDRAYFKQAAAGQAVGHQMLVGRTSGKPSLVLSKPVYENEMFKGIVAMSAQVENISNAVIAARLGETGFAFLVDEANQLVAHGSPQVLAGGASQALQDLSAYPALSGVRSGMYSYLDGERQAVAYAQTTNLGWTLIVQQDRAEAFAPLLRSRRLAALFLGSTALLVVAATFLLARSLARPLEQLSQIAEGISRGQLEAELTQTQRRDEIGTLARAVERLKVSVKIAVDELQR